MPVYGFSQRRDAETLKQVARERRGKTQQTNKTTLPQRPPGVRRLILGKPDSQIPKGDSGTVSIYGKYDDTKGSETDTGNDIESVYARVTTLNADTWVYVEWIVNGWEAVPAEC